MTFVDYFTHVLYRAPVCGSILMCMCASLMGCFMVVSRRSLIGEALSHATYPGIVISVIVGSTITTYDHPLLIIIILIGALIFASIGFKCIDILHSRFRVHIDAALCVVLSVFLGFGVLIASRIQFTHPIWYQKAQVFIYGQTVTMTDFHLYVYGGMMCLVLMFVIGCFYNVQYQLFDLEHAILQGYRKQYVEYLMAGLLVLSIVIGIRAVGVILMSGMLLAPPVAARAFTHRLSKMLLLAALFGGVSGFLGSYFSIVFSRNGVSYPTGPLILIVAVVISVLALIVSPERGLLIRCVRSCYFHRRCQLENLLKILWSEQQDKKVCIADIKRRTSIPSILLRYYLIILKYEGWMVFLDRYYVQLTVDGERRARWIVRLHRLWEVYLVSCLKVDEARVHHIAEEMEHIITPEIESQLTMLLKNPKTDPHLQPIPLGDDF